MCRWARHSDSDEWGEQWGEKYSEKGPASKWADKWARQAENVWHERWGEYGLKCLLAGLAAIDPWQTHRA